MVESANDAIFFKDLKSRYVIANNKTLESFGLSREEVIEKNDYELMPDKEEAKRNIEDDQIVFNTGKPKEITKHMKGTDGKEYWFEAIKVPQFDDNGNIIGLVGIARDITDRKNTENLLRESEEKFKSMVENISDWIWEVDKNGVYTYASPKIKDILGYKPEEIIGKTPFELMSKYETKKIAKIFGEIAKKKKPFSGLENWNVHKNGTDVLLETSGIPILDEKRNLEGYRGIDRDITERKQAEDALKERVKELNGLYGLGRLSEQAGNLEELFSRFLKDIVPESMKFPDKVCAKIELDKEEYRYTKYKCVNCLFAPIIVKGERRGKLTIGYVEEIPFIKEFEQEFEQELVNGYAERLGKIIERIEAKDALQKAYYELEERVIERTIELTKLNKELKQEIIERKNAEEELKSSRKQLRNLSLYLQNVREEERTRIAREIHDDLGQALTALKMDLSWLENRLPENQNLLFDKTASMSKLIDSTIRSVQKISAELRPGLLDDLGLSAAIEWQAEEFQKRSGISCKVNLSFNDDSLDTVLSTAIFRIFQETLTNIVRHSNATEASVSVIEQSGKLTIEVKDNGKGITEEQISDAKSLGIIGIRERVRPWGGEVNIKGKKGKGTTVAVIIPMAKPSLRD